MQPENFNKEVFCRLCFTIISYTVSEAIEKATREVLKTVLPNLISEEENKHLICKACCSKLLASFNFKSTCMATEDIIASYLNSSEVSCVDLKEIYLMTNGNIQLTDTWKNQKICRLCIQVVTNVFVPLNKVDKDIIEAYLPQVNVNATRAPVICESCFDSLCIHGGFVKNYLKTKGKYQNVDKPYIKAQEIEIKLKDECDGQERCKNINNQLYIKSEEIEIKLEEQDQENDSSSYNLDKGTIEDRMMQISEDVEETKDESEIPLNISYKNTCKRKFDCGLKQEIVPKLIYFSKVQLYRCDTCDYETRRKGDLKRHQLTHKEIKEIQIYKCSVCNYIAKHESLFIRHQLKHKDPSEIQMYKCDICTFQSRYKGSMKAHQLLHKHPSEIQMYKCGACDYEAKRKSELKRHQLLHRDSFEIQMYKCDICTYDTKSKKHFINHQLTHKEVQMYKCDCCDFVTKHKSSLKIHQLTHKDLSEIHMYKCDECDYKSKRKCELKRHQLKHKDPSEIQMYSCSTCTFKTKYKGCLRIHQLTHKELSKSKCTHEVNVTENKYNDEHQLTQKDSSENQMYMCRKCGYKITLKGYLNMSQDSSETQMNICCA